MRLDFIQRMAARSWLSRAFETSRRREVLSFGHAALDVKQLLDWAQATSATTVDLTANQKAKPEGR